jgi:hypothetical protein
MTPVSFWEYCRFTLKIPVPNFEMVTLCDDTGRNLHFHYENGKLLSGANFPETGKLHLRTITKELAFKRVKNFLKSPDSIVFGCAGILSILPEIPECGKGTIAGFFYGEVITSGSLTSFGNLMMTRIRKIS